MFGNYPVNDDWIFVRQVEAFDKGIFTLSSELDPSFVLQGFLGLAWGKIFGINFTSLQVLSLLVTLAGAFALFLLLRELRLKKSLAFLITALYFFNPLVFTSAFSFMTDNYFLTFFIFSALFYVRFLGSKDYKHLFTGALFMFFSILVRELGILTGAAFLFAYYFKDFRKGKLSLGRTYKVWVSVLVFTVAGVLIYTLWPDFGSNRAFILAEELPVRIKFMLLSLPYFPLFIFPVLIGLEGKFLKKRTILVGLVGLFTLYFYNFDIFPVGNVLYIENLHTKSNFRSNFSLFDNVFFKIFLSGLLSVAIAKFVLYKASLLREIKKLSQSELFFALLAIFNFGVLLISSDYYDRYLLPAFVTFVLFFVPKMEKHIKVSKYVYLAAVLLIFISVVLQWEFSTVSRLKYSQARKVSEKTGLVRQIYLNDTYTQYAVSEAANDYTGLINRKSTEYNCFVQSYTLDTNSGFLASVQQIEDFLDKKGLEKPKPYNSKKKRGLPRAKNNLNLLIFNQKYSSPLYNLVGKEAYVGSWCLDE